MSKKNRIKKNIRKEKLQAPHVQVETETGHPAHFRNNDEIGSEIINFVSTEVVKEEDSIDCDPYQLSRAQTQWEFGDWKRLAYIEYETLQYNPERAKLSLMAAAGCLQMGHYVEAKQYIRLAQKWGINKKLMLRVLISGVYNSLGRAAAVSNQQLRALQFFEKSINVGVLGSDAKLLSQARTREQFNQLGLLSPEGYLKARFEINVNELDFHSYKNKSCGKEQEKYEKFISEQYWEERYQRGGTSGHGSYGKLAEFKAEVINRFIKDKNIQSVIEFGCGDGNQLSMFEIKNYIGIDVSSTVVQLCKTRFQEDDSKVFYTKEEFNGIAQTADLVLSLDVIFHLVEDNVFEEYMYKLFASANKFCIIYSSDNDAKKDPAIHVKHRSFSKWIEENLSSWRLSEKVYNKYPHDGTANPRDLSFSDFYIYQRIE